MAMKGCTPMQQPFQTVTTQLAPEMHHLCVGKWLFALGRSRTSMYYTAFEPPVRHKLPVFRLDLVRFGSNLSS